MEALCFTEKWDQRNVLNFILYDLYFEKLENVNICFVTLETQSFPRLAGGGWRVAGGG